MPQPKVDPSTLQSARNTEVGQRFNQALFSALDALEEAGIAYAVIGGVASSGLGRPRATHDIDIFVSPDDAGATLKALEKYDFTTEKTDPVWLFKAFKDEILVDIIFKSRGDIYFDTEMANRARFIGYHGRSVRTVSPEDLVIIKCVVHDEIGPHHWHDALAVLSHATIDWPYLLKRARRAPRRLLALLVYAQSNDIFVPNWAVFQLFREVYGDVTQHVPQGVSHTQSMMTSPPQAKPATPLHLAQRHHAPQYIVARLKEGLAEDPRTGEQDLKFSVEGNRILVRGEVLSEERKRAADSLIRELAPGFEVENNIRVSVHSGPEGVEEVG